MFTLKKILYFSLNFEVEIWSLISFFLGMGHT